MIFVGILYPIKHSNWVSPHCGGIQFKIQNSIFVFSFEPSYDTSISLFIYLMVITKLFKTTEYVTIKALICSRAWVESTIA